MRREFGQIPGIQTNSANPDKIAKIRTNERKNGQIPQIQTNQSFPCPNLRKFVRFCAALVSGLKYYIGLDFELLLEC